MNKPKSARRPARRTKRVKSDGRKPFLARNDFLRDFLTFNVELNDLLGIESKADQWPFNVHNPKPVARLLEELKGASTPEG